MSRQTQGCSVTSRNCPRLYLGNRCSEKFFVATAGFPAHNNPLDQFWAKNKIWGCTALVDLSWSAPVVACHSTVLSVVVVHMHQARHHWFPACLNFSGLFWGEWFKKEKKHKEHDWQSFHLPIMKFANHLPMVLLFPPGNNSQVELLKKKSRKVPSRFLVM